MAYPSVTSSPASFATPSSLRFPRAGPPCCRDCDNVTHRRNITGSSNPNGNGGRPYYKCECGWCERPILSPEILTELRSGSRGMTPLTLPQRIRCAGAASQAVMASRESISPTRAKVSSIVQPLLAHSSVGITVSATFSQRCPLYLSSNLRY